MAASLKGSLTLADAETIVAVEAKNDSFGKKVRVEFSKGEKLFNAPMHPDEVRAFIRALSQALRAIGE